MPLAYSIILKSQLEGGLRLDAEYYQPEYLEVAKILQSTPHKNFNDVVSNIINGVEIREYVEKDGLPYLRVSDIKEFFIDLSSVVHISKESKVKQNIKLKENDILLSRSGSLAIAAVVTPDLSNSVMSSHLMRIPVKGVNPYFLVAFLNSKFGKDQIMRRNNGTIVPEINHPSLKSLLIPVLSEAVQKEIEKIVRNAYEETQESNKIYFQAEKLLLGELGLKDFEVEDDLSYIIKLSEVKSARRADAEFFQPKYDKLVEKIKKHNAKLLKELVRRVKAKIRPKSEEVYKYIEISDVSVGSGDVSFNEIIGKELPANARIPIKGSELLVSKVRPTRGAIAIVPNNFDNNFICSGAFSVFSAPEILREYLFLVLRSIVGKLQFEKPTTGTSYPTITDGDVENLIIPVLPKSTQQKIADLVQKSHETRSKAKQLLGQARNRVENLIKVKS